MLCPTRFVVDATENSKDGCVDKAKGEPKLGSKDVFDDAEEDGVEVNAERRNIFIEKQTSIDHEDRRKVIFFTRHWLN